MSTVILGGGIIGASIAYYLSASQPDGEIHIIEPSGELFSGASGYAAGFLARDWVAHPLAPLGALSFDLHHDLATEHDGDKKWGYMRGTAFSLDIVPGRKVDGGHGDDWMQGSRGESAPGSEDANPMGWPSWLTKQEGGCLEKINEGETVAQVDPLRLSRFLINAAVSRGVKVHHPAKVTAVVKDANDTIIGVKLLSLDSNSESTIPCTHIVLSAGPWTPQLLRDLFPSSRVDCDIIPLAGYSLVIRSPRYTLTHERQTHRRRSHAVFTSNPRSCGFSPEIFTREGGEIYIAGLNSPTMKLPSRVEDRSRLFDPDEMQRLKDVAVGLMGDIPKDTNHSTTETANTNDLEVLREGLCFRPVASRGVPIIGRIDDASLENGGNNHRSEGGVFIAAGHGPWGISLSLGTGKVVCEMIKGQPLSADVSGLAV